MATKEHHEELINGIYEQLKEIFESSAQAIYIYLDDAHKVCNAKYASLLGFKSPKEWADIKNPVGETVDKKSQKSLVLAYKNAMEKLSGSTINVTWKKKSGKTVDTTVILVPLSYNGHLFALHFVS